jgi:epoxyqueuosine reductase
MNWPKLEAQATPYGLFLMGVAHDGGRTIALLGASLALWPRFQASAEYSDDAPDPLDRWSKRIIGQIADRSKARACFPSDGPPYPAFIAWAKSSGRFWSSPTGMLVHDVAGLMISIRGALIWEDLLSPPKAAAETPCAQCDAPCVSACPVSALSVGAIYDVPRCKSHIKSAGAECMNGCLVRRACPISERFERDPKQSRFHMRAFMGE